MKTALSVKLTLLALCLTGLLSRGELITYSYDSAGRLTGANYGSGRSTSYNYDSAGNRVKTAQIVFVDGDNDGMDDNWENLYFLTTARDGTGDFDLDGMSDLAEFLAGTLPNNNLSLLKISSEVMASSVSTSIEWSSVAGRTYRVQYKSSLSDPGWNDLPGDIVAVGAMSSKIDTTSKGVAKRFYRVQVLP